MADLITNINKNNSNANFISLYKAAEQGIANAQYDLGLSIMKGKA
jgi:hypothetical protein